MTPDPITQVISVPPITPAETVVIANSAFTSTLAKVELEIAHLKITDDQSAQAAANLLQRLTTAGTALEKARKTVKEPFLAKCREIDEAAALPAARIEKAKSLLKTAQTNWAIEQQKKAQEAERARQAELARLEKLRAEEERVEAARKAEMERLAAEAAAASKAPVMDVDFGDEPAPEPPKTEVQRQIEAVKHAPAVVAKAPVGVAFKTRLIIDTIDVNKLPDMFVTRVANEKAIRATFTEGWKEGEPIPTVPGCTFKVDKQVASTGKAVF